MKDYVFFKYLYLCVYLQLLILEWLDILDDIEIYIEIIMMLII